MNKPIKSVASDESRKREIEAANDWRMGVFALLILANGFAALFYILW